MYNTTFLMWPRLLYACFVVSGIAITCYSIRRSRRTPALDKVVLDKSFKSARDLLLSCAGFHTWPTDLMLARRKLVSMALRRLDLHWMPSKLSSQCIHTCNMYVCVYIYIYIHTHTHICIIYMYITHIIYIYIYICMYTP